MVGSAAIKQGRSANRKHTYFFFWPESKLKLDEGGKEFLKENLFRRKQKQLCLKSPPTRAKRELTKLTNRKAVNK